MLRGRNASIWPPRSLNNVFEILVAPMRGLLTSLGSGEMPDGGPSAQLRMTSSVLGDVRGGTVAAARDLDSQWQGATATATMSSLERSGRHNVALAERGSTTATVIDAASDMIRGGYKDLTTVLDSFSAFADAGGPELLTPVGLPLLLRSAQEHLTTAVKVIERVRDDLDGETKKLQAIADEQVKAHDALLARDGAVDRLGAHAAPGTQLATDAASTVAVAGGVHVQLPNGKVVTAPNEKAAAAVRAALTQQGVPYVWGGTTPGKGLDCSGLTQYSYRQAGVGIPRLAQEQTGGARISESQAMAGDLVVWDGHVAMALGDGTMIEAGDPVAISAMRTDNIGMGYKGVYRPTA